MIKVGNRGQESVFTRVRRETETLSIGMAPQEAQVFLSCLFQLIQVEILCKEEFFTLPHIS